MQKRFFWLAAFPLFIAPMHAQVSPAAHGGRSEVSFWVGASISTFNPDYGCTDASPFSCWDHHLLGIGPYVDTNYFLWDRIGLEGEARLLLFHGPDTLIQNSYLGGPRMRVFRSRELNLNAKLLLGWGTLDVPAPAIGGGGYFVYAPGLAIDYRVTKHVAARVEYEYQFWPGYPCYKCGGGGHGGLTPNGFSFGVSYAVPSRSAY